MASLGSHLISEFCLLGLELQVGCHAHVAFIQVSWEPIPVLMLVLINTLTTEAVHSSSVLLQDPVRAQKSYQSFEQ